MNKVESALSRTTDTKALVIGIETLPRVADMFKELFPGRRALVVADANTWRAAGGDVHRILAQAGRAACFHRSEALCRVDVCRTAGRGAVPHRRHSRRSGIGRYQRPDQTLLAPQRAPLYGRGNRGVDGRLYGLRSLDHQGRQQTDLRLSGSAGHGARSDDRRRRACENVGVGICRPDCEDSGRG